MNDRFVECRRNCAFNLPAMFEFASGLPENVDSLIPTFRNLASDSYFMVRRTVACGFHEVSCSSGPAEAAGRVCLTGARRLAGGQGAGNEERADQGRVDKTAEGQQRGSAARADPTRVGDTGRAAAESSDRGRPNGHVDDRPGQGTDQMRSGSVLDEQLATVGAHARSAGHSAQVLQQRLRVHVRGAHREEEGAVLGEWLRSASCPGHY